MLMNEVVNLRRVRKAKARQAEEATAAQNRASFGRSKSQKALAKAQKEDAERKLDGHKRNDDDSNF